jgi:NhaA family Na+:H+ antiporter
LKTIKDFTNLLLEQCLVFGLLLGFYFSNHDYELYHKVISFNLFNWLGDHMTIEFIIREAAITGLFGIVIAEIMKDRVAGKFSEIASVVQPGLGAIGGVIMPMTFFLILIHVFGYEHAWKGILVVAATDIAFSLQVGKINYLKKSKVIVYLSLLAVADDIIIIVLSMFFPNPEHPFNPAGFMIIGTVLGITYYVFKYIDPILHRLLPWLQSGLTSLFPEQEFPRLHLDHVPHWQMVFGLVLGAMMWNALLVTGLHPILALVFIFPLMIKTKPIGEQASGRRAMEIFEHKFDIPVKIGLAAFGFLAGGIPFTGWEIFTEPFALIVATSLVLGKMIGIPLFSKYGINPLRATARWMHQYYSKRSMTPPKAVTQLRGIDNIYTNAEQLHAGILGGIGFTVAILMSQLLFKGEPELRDQGTIGAVMSLFLVLVIQLGIRLNRVLRG